MVNNITIKDLSVSYGTKTVLNNVFLTLTPGHIYGVLGPNGAGKSTFFKAILGLLQPDEGLITFDGQPVSEMYKKIVYLPQKDDIDWQFPATVMDIVLMGRFPFKKFWQRINKEDERLALLALDDLGIKHLKDRQISELSGGQQQRVFLARALCQNADVYLLDEPFVGIDIKTEGRIIELLKELADHNKTLLVVHHDLSTVTQYFDQVILLNGRVVSAGPTPETFTEENIARAYGGQLTILHKTNMLTEKEEPRKK